MLRKGVPTGETVSSVVIAAGLVATTVWVFGQKDAFDHEARDLPTEYLTRGGPKIELYRQPLKVWQEPGTTQTVSAGPDMGPFPVALAADGWALSGRVRAFSADTLYEKINGEAEKFIRQGFQSLHYAVLRAADGTELAIELFDQGALGGSLGVFAEHRPADRTIEEAAGVSYFLTSVGVIGRMGRYFFRAAADRSGDLVRTKSLQLVNTLAALVDGSLPAAAGSAAPASPGPELPLGGATAALAAQPSGTGTLPDAQPELVALTRALGVSESRLAFEAENVFQFDFARAFWFADLDGGGRAFVHGASDERAATQLLALLVEEQGFDYATAESPDDSTLMRHEFLKTWFAVAHHGRFVVGVENGADQTSALDATRRLLEAVAGGR